MQIHNCSKERGASPVPFFCLFIWYSLLKQGGIAPAPTTILFQKALLQPLYIHKGRRQFQ